MAVSINGTNGVTFNDGSAVATAASLGMHNKLINGAMDIDQRNAGAAVVVSTENFVTDRWIVYKTAGGLTGQQVSDAPAGFSKSLRVTVTSTNSSPTALIQQRIEGLNAIDLAWGTASAKTVTVSFWVKSSVTGTFGVLITNWSGTRASYAASYTVNSASTWEYKTLTIPGDTAGTWLVDNTQHSQVRWTLAPGSAAIAAGSWQNVDALGLTGQTNLLATNGATFAITGAQFEVGSVATPYERRPYIVELQLAQRYYEKSYNSATAPGSVQDNGYVWSYTNFISGSANDVGASAAFRVSKRAAPTMTYYSPSTGASGKVAMTDSSGSASDANANAVTAGENFALVYGSRAGSTNAQVRFHFVASAEL